MEKDGDEGEGGVACWREGARRLKTIEVMKGKHPGRLRVSFLNNWRLTDIDNNGK